MSPRVPYADPWAYRIPKDSPLSNLDFLKKLPRPLADPPKGDKGHPDTTPQVHKAPKTPPDLRRRYNCIFEENTVTYGTRYGSSKIRRETPRAPKSSRRLLQGLPDAFSRFPITPIVLKALKFHVLS